MDNAEELERVCAAGWPAPVQDKIGDWLLRSAADPAEDGTSQRVRFTGRANSALAVGDPGIPTEQALSRVCEFAHSNGIAPLVQAIAGSATERELARCGWRVESERVAGSEVSVQISPLDAATPSSATIEPVPTPGWWELTVGDTEPTPAQRAVLTAGEVGYGLRTLDGETAGALRVALVGSLVYVSTLAVREQHRRRGLAGDLMAAANAWGLARSATHCVLQVAVGNSGALALYTRLGFAESHRYHYWVPPQPCEDHGL